jgi:hypothetical protein
MLGPGSGGRGATMPAGSTGTRFGDAVQFTRTFPAGDEDLRAITKAPQKKSLDPDTSGKATVCLLSLPGPTPSNHRLDSTLRVRGSHEDTLVPRQGAGCGMLSRAATRVRWNVHQHGILRLFFCDRESCLLLCVSEVEREQMESERESRSLPWPAEPADTLECDCHSVGNSAAFGLGLLHVQSSCGFVPWALTTCQGCQGTALHCSRRFT